MRKILSIVLAAAMFMTSLVSASAAGVSFKDVNGHWAEEYIILAGESSLVQGYDGKYRPDDSMTRAELVTILWRAEGEPAPKGNASFSDLTQDWYKEAVAWAEENRIVNGVGSGKFDPNGKVSREQLATILFRLAGGVSGFEKIFTSVYDEKLTDEEKISSYAKDAVYWCIFNEVYCGVASTEVGNTVSPKSDATRGQIAVMMIRYLGRNK